MNISFKTGLILLVIITFAVMFGNVLADSRYDAMQAQKERDKQLYDFMNPVDPGT